jgi:hypothetical protein
MKHRSRNSEEVSWNVAGQVGWGEKNRHQSLLVLEACGEGCDLYQGHRRSLVAAPALYHLCTLYFFTVTLFVSLLFCSIS